MIKFHIHADEVTTTRLARLAAVTRSRAARIVLGAGLIVVPMVAIAAPLTVPNTFSAGTVISSSEMNANFTAVKDAIDDNDAHITALEASPSLADCTWVRNTVANTQGVSATCPAGSFAIGGSCPNIGPKDFSRPTPVPAGGENATTIAGWNCQYSVQGNHDALALCCPQ